MDKSSALAQNPRAVVGAWHLFTEMNLILCLDYGCNSFDVLKNRWGPNALGLPLKVLVTFLYNPTVTDARELNRLRIDHENLFATREPEQ